MQNNQLVFQVIHLQLIMTVYQLNKKIIFPPPELAEPNGLLAIGGDLTPLRLLTAYKTGIFPWFIEDEPILWWAPSPRLVLIPDEFHVPRRLARTIKQEIFTVTADTSFPEVISSCARVRIDTGEETWITDKMLEAYCRLYELGYAHSIECWKDNQLIGGLYGVALDRVFFGESMFSKTSDASKVALAALVDFCRRREIQLIDCQVTSQHLKQFGAREISGALFQKYLMNLIQTGKPQQVWTNDLQ